MKNILYLALPKDVRGFLITGLQPDGGLYKKSAVSPESAKDWYLKSVREPYSVKYPKMYINFRYLELGVIKDTSPVVTEKIPVVLDIIPNSFPFTVMGQSAGLGTQLIVTSFDALEQAMRFKARFSPTDPSELYIDCSCLYFENGSPLVPPIDIPK